MWHGRRVEVGILADIMLSVHGGVLVWSDGTPQRPESYYTPIGALALAHNIVYIVYASSGQVRAQGPVGVPLSRRRGYAVVAGVAFKGLFVVPNCDAYSLCFWQS